METKKAYPKKIDMTRYSNEFATMKRVKCTFSEACQLVTLTKDEINERYNNNQISK